MQLQKFYQKLAKLCDNKKYSMANKNYSMNTIPRPIKILGKLLSNPKRSFLNPEAEKTLMTKIVEIIAIFIIIIIITGLGTI